VKQIYYLICQTGLFFFLPFLLAYSLYGGGYVVTIQNSPTLYFVYIIPSQPHPVPLTAITKFPCFISYMYIKPMNNITSPSSLPQVHPTYCTYFIVCLSLQNTKSMFKRVSQCIPAVNMLYFGQCNSPLPLPSNPPLSDSFQYITFYHLLAQMWLIYFGIVDSQSFSFPFLPLPSSTV
jgi:hypothetical protein